MIYSPDAKYLLSAQTTSGAGLFSDTRNAPNYHFVVYAAAAPSAIVKLEASVDSTGGWMPIATYTAIPGSGSAQLAGYYPFVRGVLNSAFGGGGSTGSAWLYLAPGVK